MAISLNYTSAFSFNSGDDIVFDPASKNLFVLRNSRLSEQPRVTELSINQVTTTGQIVSSFTSDELPNSGGISLLPNGNLLVLSPRARRMIEFTKSGQIVRGGLDIRFDPSLVEAGIIFNAATNTLFSADFLTPSILEIDVQGNVIGRTDLSASIPGQAGLQGITIDPLTGNFYVVQDDPTDGTNEGNLLYEVTRSGQVLSRVNIKDLTGFADLEGVTIDPTTRTLYTVFDDDDPTGLKVYFPNRSRVAAFKIEVETFAGDTGANDSQVGDAGANSFLGGLGSDTYSGGAGDDIIDGGSDNDILNGNEGNDQIVGGAGIDFGRGGNGDDGISGGAGDDTLFGDVGNDNIAGGAGNDIINGNLGNDILNGGEGNDLVRGGRGDDYLTGAAGNDTVHGDEGFDTIDGGEGNDSLLGESGEDVIYGGMGNDTLIGGGSRDRFVLAQGTGSDVIVDFVAGTDSIGLTNGVTYDQLSFTQEQVNNVITTQIRFSSTGEILASLEGIATATLTRNMFAAL